MGDSSGSETSRGGANAQQQPRNNRNCIAIIAQQSDAARIYISRFVGMVKVDQEKRAFGINILLYFMAVRGTHSHAKDPGIVRYHPSSDF